VRKTNTGKKRIKAEVSRTAPKRPPAGADQADCRSAVVEIARRRLHDFVGLERKVLQGNNPDAIHDFRVASRRLQQVLDLLHPAPHPGRIRKLRRVIRRARRLLSTVRNCDVLLERVKEALAKNHPGHHESWEAFKEFLVEQRKESFQKAAAKLSGLNLSEFYVQCQDCLNPEPAAARNDLGHDAGHDAESPDPGRAPHGDAFREALATGVQAAWEAFAAQRSGNAAQGSASSLHAVRIAAKRLRYAIEVIGEVGAPESDQILTWLRRLQQHLGDWNDLEVMEEMMAEMLSRPRFLRSNVELAMRVEKLMLRNRRSKRVYENRYRRAAGGEESAARWETWIGNLTSSQAGTTSNL
jgi:CHAD domain-containing protein